MGRWRSRTAHHRGPERHAVGDITQLSESATGKRRPRALSLPDPVGGLWPAGWLTGFDVDSHGLFGFLAEVILSASWGRGEGNTRLWLVHGATDSVGVEDRSAGRCCIQEISVHAGNRPERDQVFVETRIRPTVRTAPTGCGSCRPSGCGTPLTCLRTQSHRVQVR